MFYSHEVLTSRKYGVATVWLVATLGSKSSLKKVSRKAILDVNVRKACETILGPEAPMALRLQSNLLYGVTRVYAQQCGYVLSDAEVARNNMRIMLKVMQQAGLEPEGANKARTDQIALQDDPNFLLDLEVMPMNIDDVNFSYMEDTQQHISSPHSSSRSRPTTGSQQSIGGLIIPPSASSFAGGPLGGADLFSVRGDTGPGTAKKAAPRDLVDEDLGLDLGHDAYVGSGDAFRGQNQELFGGSQRSDNATGIAFANTAPQMPDEDVFTGDDFQPAIDDPADALNDESLSLHDQTQHETTSETASAPNKRKRANQKTVQVDKETTLQNRDIAAWSKTYLQRMKTESRRKQMLRDINIAKRNAEYLLLTAGTYIAQEMRGPLDMFSGAGLLEAFTGFNLLTGAKRGRDAQDEGNSGPTKRARAEQNSDEVARSWQDGDDLMPPIEDDTIEQGRDAPTPLDDRYQSSVFPWNQSAGSRRPTDANPTSASFGGGPQLNLLSRRGSRLTSASPLVGRGTIAPEIDDFQLPAGSDIEMDGMFDADGINGDDEFELYGPAAQVDTQTAAQSQWQKSILTSESANFLSFVETAIEEDEEQGNTINLAVLLPPECNSNIVAAQAMLHVLTLGTKGVLGVHQAEPFGPIALSIVYAG